ncbi:DUF7344 domain-containing protein [Halorubellus salinus]|uniref:DUF7344 domain-containing protein n=1 Tax=Halorubellus salinus TaxID=755309 RepID=UPI001D07B79E|nr:hypothetical protein [Halorubellus salinus]
MNDTSENNTDPQSEPDGIETADDGTPAALEDPLVGSGTDDNLPLERVFDILRNERRQRVLGYLAITDDEVIRIGDLAEHVAAIENDMPVNALSSQQRKRVYVALYQCHLPKMADADVIEFDKDRGTIKVGPNAKQLRPYLDIEPEPGDEATSVETPFAVLSVAGVVAYLFAALAGGTGIAIGGLVLLAGILAAALIGYRDHVA